MTTQSDDMFETVTRNSKTYRVVKDGKQVHFKMTMMDSGARLEEVDRPSKPRHVHDNRPVRISDGSGDPLSLCRPGWRQHTALDKRAELSESKELDRLSAMDAKDAEFKNISSSWSNNPPTGQGVHPVPGIEDIPEGTSCTINGWPGHWQWVNGVRVCVPDNKKADNLSIYDAYDLAKSQEWRTPAVATDQAEEEDDGDDDTDGDNDEEDADEILRKAFEQGAVERAYYGTSTHTESSPPQRFHGLRGDALKRDTLKRLNQHDADMQQIYNSYDQSLQNAWRR